MRSFFLITFIILLTGCFAEPVEAQEPTPSDDQVNAIAEQLYCPVCENTPLDVCPTEACRQWRALIREQLADGWTEDQIKTYFVENYGARVLAEPPATGLNVLFYILPVVVILAAALVLFRSLRAWTQPSPARHASVEGEAGAGASEAEYVAKLEEELKQRK
jgi:cytochrome c-type biogenesis protein CcmH